MNKDVRTIDKLMEQLSSLGLNCEEDTPLLDSGLLESLGLMQMARWIETEVGGALDLTAFDLREEWRTPRAMASFIEAQKTS